MGTKNIQEGSRAALLSRIMFFLVLVIGGFGPAYGQRNNNLARARELTSQGDQLLDDKQYQRAIDQYNAAILLISTYAPAYAGKGRAYFILKRYEAARVQLRSALMYNYTEPAWVNWVMGLTYLEEEKPSEALNWVSEAVYLDSANARYRITKGRTHYSLKQYQEARQEYLKALESDQKNIEANILLGDSYFALKEYRSAIDAYKRVVSPTPEFANVYYAIGNAYVYLGQDYNAIPAYQNAISLKTEFLADVYVNLGFAQYRQRKLGEAEHSFQRAVDLQPDYIDAYEGMSLVKIRTCDYATAISHEKKALELARQKSLEQAGFYISLSWYYSFIGENQLAADAGRNATRYAPKNHMGYTNLCRALNDLRRYTEAINVCQDALRVKPGDGETLFYLGRAWKALGKTADANRAFAEAISGLERHVSNNPNDEDGYYLLGNIYYEQKLYQGAIRAFRQAVSLKPCFSHAHFNLGVAYYASGNRTAALAQYKALAGLDPSKANNLWDVIHPKKKP